MAFLRKLGVLNFSNVLFSCPFHTSVFLRHSTVGIIVIGDEILKGQVADTNSHFIARHLFELGVKVQKISVVGDIEDEIVQEVREFSDKYSYVITTGGIGPTHDDVTFSAVAKAFGEKLKLHPDLRKFCAKFYKTDDVNSPSMKLAHIPESAVLTYGYDKVNGRRTLYPNISVRNVFLFPGIPNLMERLFLAVYKEQFSEGSSKVFSHNVYVNVTEVDIANCLNTVVNKYPDVSIGSYPQLFNRYYQVHLTIQSTDKDNSGQAYEELLSILPKGSIVEFDAKPTYNSYKKLRRLIKEKGNNKVSKAVEIVEQSINLYRPSEICLLFNGDVESTAILHLYHSCTRKDSEHTKLNVASIIKEDNLELQQYILDTQTRYRVNVTRLSDAFDDSLKAFFDYQQSYKLVFFGCVAQTNSNMVDLLNNIQENYPSVEWINPLSSWTDADLWDFIHSLYLPYNIIYK